MVVTFLPLSLMYCPDTLHRKPIIKIHYICVQLAGLTCTAYRSIRREFLKSAASILTLRNTVKHDRESSGPKM